MHLPDKDLLLKLSWLMIQEAQWKNVISLQPLTADSNFSKFWCYDLLTFPFTSVGSKD